LTVHGSGGQTRAFIHISDTVRCIRMALESPAAPGEYRVFNQAAECRRVIDLADMVCQRTGATIRHIDNPRKEAAENDLALQNAGLRSLGWQPVTLDDTALLDQLIAEAWLYKSRANADKILSTAKW
jgi:UDP-sulfoquinovose synthase